jgi:hypothetical protein
MRAVFNAIVAEVEYTDGIIHRQERRTGRWAGNAEM